MCYSRAEGGQRCFGHARITLSKARADIDRDPSDENYEKYRKAEIEFASTRQGAAAIRSRLEELRTQIETTEPWAQRLHLQHSADTLDEVLTRGEMLRERNAAVRAAGRPALTEADDRDMYTTVAPEPVPDVKSAHMATFKADLDARFADMRGDRAGVAVRAAERVINTEQSRHDLLANARAEQSLAEANGHYGASTIKGVPLGGAPAIAPSQGFAVARTLAMRTFGGAVSSQEIAQHLTRYATDDPFNPHTSFAPKQAQFTARIERYMTREQAHAAAQAHTASSRLLSKVGSSPGAPAECARIVDHLIAAKTDEERQAAAQQMFSVMRDGSNQVDTKVAAEETAALVHTLTGRKAYVRTGPLAALRGVEGTLRYID